MSNRSSQYRCIARRALPSLVVFGISAASGPLHAQSYPNKPIRLITGFAAGGASDQQS